MGFTKLGLYGGPRGKYSFSNTHEGTVVLTHVYTIEGNIDGVFSGDNDLTLFFLPTTFLQTHTI